METSRKNINDVKGALTVEASLSLVVFIFAFLSILYLCKFARAQIVLQHAVNQTAKEISQYSYLTNKLGLRNDKSKSEKFINDTDKIISDASNLMNLIKSEKDELEDYITGDYEIDDYYDYIKTYKKYDENGNKIKNPYQKIEEATNVFVNNAKEYLKDPKVLLKGFVEIAKDEIADFAISKYIAAPLSNILIQKYLPSGSNSANEYLLKLGVDGGLEGLNFDTSTIFKNGSNIDITLIYNMSLKLPLIVDKTLCFRVNASTVGWQSKLFKIDGSSDEDEEINQINIWDINWKERTHEFEKIIMREFDLAAVRTPISLDFYDHRSNLYTYVHSMNTELKSYSNDGALNLSAIKSQIKLYAKDALKDTSRTEKITMEDGIVYDGADVKNNQDIKIIMVVKDTASSSIESLKKLVEDIKKELKCNNLEIEFYFSDGVVDVGKE